MSFRAAGGLRSVSRKGRNGKLSTFQANIMDAFLYLSIFTLITTSVEFFLHVNDKDSSGRLFAGQNLFFLAFSTTIFIPLMFRAWKRVKPQDYKLGGFLQGWGYIFFFWSIFTVTVFIIHTTISQFLQVQVRFEILPVEVYFFYLNAAIAETIFFNVFLHLLLKNGLAFLFKIAKEGKMRDKDLIGNVLITIATITIISILFGLSHLNVYGNEPLLVASTIFSMVLWETSHELTKNPFIAMLSHLALNAIVAVSIVLSL